MAELTKLYFSIGINLIILVATVAIVISYFVVPTGEKKDGPPIGAKKFRYYTTDSNIFLAVSSGITFFLELINCIGRGEYLPHFIVLLKFFAVTTVMVTFFTVIFFLGPAHGYGVMLGGTSFYMHFLGPVFAVLSFCFLEDVNTLNKASSGYISFEEALVAIVPSLIYGLIYFRQVVLVRSMHLTKHPEDNSKENIPGWPDFYGFNQSGKWMVSAVVMTLGVLVLSLAVRALHNGAHLF